MDRPRSIVAMKGHPFTRKTEFATLIAKSLKCPVFSLDDVLDVLNPDTIPSPPAIDPRDVAFDILCRVASSHLLKEAYDNIVIDSPLSSQNQLDLLIKLGKSFSILYPESRLVIVECKPRNNYSWKLKFDSYLKDHTCSCYGRKWYKPTKWDDIEKAILDSFDEKPCQVSKLVLDPLLDLPKFFDIGPSEHPLFMEAIQYMTTRKEGEGTTNNTVMYHEWRQLRYTMSSLSWMDMRKGMLCKGGHCITRYSEEGVGHKADCMGCGKQVNGTAAVYTCKDCSLALHKDCAESFGNKDLRVSELVASHIHACSPCKEDRKSGSRNCASCLFETNLRKRIMPTVIRHECDKHFLSLVIPPVKNEGYLCAACGDCDLSDSYSCKICNLAYHFECLTEVPHRTKHVHGDHHHHMLLNFSTTVEEEDYICHECQDWRDPQLWYYSCEVCPYEAHLYCVLLRRKRMPPLSRFVGKQGRSVNLYTQDLPLPSVSKVGKQRHSVKSFVGKLEIKRGATVPSSPLAPPLRRASES